jgi:DNA-binding winged helix-turn-helix (wHTH) protein
MDLLRRPLHISANSNRTDQETHTHHWEATMLAVLSAASLSLEPQKLRPVCQTSLPSAVKPAMVSRPAAEVRRLGVKVAMFGRFQLCPDQRILLEQGRPVKLGGHAMDLLIALVERAGSVISKQELLARAWPGVVVEESNLRVQILTLRRALRDCEPQGRYISTVNNRGYCFVAAVARGEAADETLAGRPIESSLSVAILLQASPRLEQVLSEIQQKASELGAELILLSIPQHSQPDAHLVTASYERVATRAVPRSQDTTAANMRSMACQDRQY